MNINVDRGHQSALGDPRNSLRLWTASLNVNKATIYRTVRIYIFIATKWLLMQEIVMKPDGSTKRVEFCSVMKSCFRSFNNIRSSESNFYINAHLKKMQI